MTAPLLTLLCLACVAALVAAERWQRGALIAVTKTTASGLFIAVALSLGAADSALGRWVLAALVLGAAGDVCLLSRRDAAFMAGLGFFLLSHLAYARGFGAGPLHAGALAGAALAMAVVGALTLRWLWPHLQGVFRPAVLAYVLAIALMVVLAIGWGAARGDWRPVLGALLFAASDISVARQAFVARGFVNVAWGLPAYYVAQLLMAWTLAG